MSKRNKILILVLSIAISLLMLLLKDHLKFFSSWGYFGVFILNLVGSATVIVPTIPGLVSTFVAGSVLNPFFVGLAAAFGASLGEITGYFIGVGGKGLIKEDKRVKRIEGWMDKHGLWVIFILAAVPNPVFDIAGIIAGASGIPLYKYLIVVFLGKLIKFSVVSYLGYWS